MAELLDSKDGEAHYIDFDPFEKVAWLVENLGGGAERLESCKRAENSKFIQRRLTPRSAKAEVIRPFAADEG
jgi:hypothetical protein